MWTFSFIRIGTEMDKWFRVRVRNLIGVDRPLVGAGDGGGGGEGWHAGMLNYAPGTCTYSVAWGPGGWGGGETLGYNYRGQDYMRQSCLEQKDRDSKEREPVFWEPFFLTLDWKYTLLKKVCNFANRDFTNETWLVTSQDGNGKLTSMVLYLMKVIWLPTILTNFLPV